MEQQDYLQDFVQAKSLVELADAVRRAQAVRRIHAIAGDPKFREGVDRLIEIASDETAGPDRLGALDVLSRIGSQVRSVRQLVKTVLPRVLSKELPPLVMTPDLSASDDNKGAEGRLNVALMLRDGTETWIRQYRLDSLKEEKADKVRRELILQVIQTTATLASALDEFSAAFRTWSPDTKNPTETAFFRARDLLKGISAALSELRVEPGEFGPSLVRLLHTCIGKFERSASSDLSSQLATALLDTVDRVLSSNLLATFDASSYDSVRAVRNWWTRAPDAVIQMIDPIQRKLLDAMTVLARSGTPSESLASALISVSGGRDEASRLGREAVARTPGLSSGAQAWLAFDQRRHEANSVVRRLEGAQYEETDYALGLLMLDAERLSGDSSGVEGNTGQRSELPAEIAARGNSSQILTNRIKALIVGIRNLAERRGLEIRFHPGEVVEFSSNAHESMRGETVREPQVRVVTPMVVRITAAGLESVVVKARVTNMDGGTGDEHR